jgi:predicted secreted protein
MAAPQKGKNLMVSIGGKFYGFATDCDISIDVDTKEIASGSYKFSSAKGNWKEYETERTGWSINSNHLATVTMADEYALFTAMTSGDPVEVSYETVTVSASSTTTSGETGTINKATTSKGYKGSAVITSFKHSSSQDGDATYSITLQGTGELKTIS